MSLWISLLLFVLPAAAGHATAAQPPAPDRAVVARGAEVYRAQKCQACHAIAGAGNRRYPLDGVGSKLTDAQIRAWIVAPREMNPKVRKRAYDKLPKDDLDALVVYLTTLRTP